MSRVALLNVFIARGLRRGKDIQVIVVGGVYQHQSKSFVGTSTKSIIDQINFGRVFIAINGFSEEAGFTCKDMMRVEVTARIIECRLESSVLTDSSKFGRDDLLDRAS